MDHVHQAQVWSRLADRAHDLIGQPAECAGNDVTGVVRVRVSPRGLVVEVTVDERWRSRLTAVALPAAVIEAAAAAGGRRLAAMVAGGGGESPAVTMPFAAARWRADPAEALDAAMHLLSVTRRAASAMRDRSGDGSLDHAYEVVGTSRQGHVRITMAGFGVQSVAIDPRWLDQADHRQLSRELTEAAVSVSTCPVTAMLDEDSGGAVTELRQLVADPADLLARLGLPVRDAGSLR